MDYVAFTADDKTICVVVMAIKLIGEARKRVLEYFPLDFVSQSATKGDFQETGFWEKEQGISAIVFERDKILGHIEYFPTLPYLDELELSCHINPGEKRGGGIVSEAVNVLTNYLINRLRLILIRLIIHPENTALKRVAGEYDDQ